MEAPKLTIERAKKLRRPMTPPELRLWNILRRESLPGLRFRRQHPIGPYILDFYCPALRLAIEVDGEGHGLPDQARHDDRRERWLVGQDIRTLRFRAIDVRDNADGVVTAILIAAAECAKRE